MIGGSMAGLITHALFITDVLANIEIEYDIDIARTCASGPDLFYSTNIACGKRMHRQHTKLFFENYINYIKYNQLQSDIKIVSSLYGFISHYILDKTLHPYIFYKTGVYNANDEQTFKYYNLHTKMEKYIDYKILENNNINYKNFKAWLFLFSPKQYPTELKELLNEVIYKTYKYEKAGYDYFKAINKYRFNYHFIRYDRLGIKYYLYKLIDYFRPYKSSIALLSNYKVDEMDLNLNHNVWYHPVTNQAYNDSLCDLIQKARNQYLQIIIELNKVLFDNNDTTLLYKLLGNDSYINGLDCNTYSTEWR